MTSLSNPSDRWSFLVAGGIALLLLSGCASSNVIGLPTGPVASAGPQATAAPVDLTSEQVAADQEKVEELARPGAQAYAAPQRPEPVQPEVAQGDTDPDVPQSQAAVGNDVLPWPTIDRWPADQAENRLLTAEEADATRQSLQDRAAAQIRQAFEIMSLKKQREAAKEVISDAAARTKEVLTGIASRCRTGQADEACEDGQLTAEGDAANAAATKVR